MSTVVGDEKLTSREDQIGLLFLYVKSDENMLPKVNKISKTEAQTFNIFDKLIGPLQFCCM
ncbi:CpsL protein [Streptococcus thermophilus MTH17CL396]|nr:capsular biosynthesis protein CpsL [Streptococcus thermophilus]ETW91645.1 CpsL protein [Streptococcus thermophilus MTH17CL396]EWM62758.1 CpsL protein [Streptococcus thermophilus TH1477]